jgi:hypothetical protein
MFGSAVLALFLVVLGVIQFTSVCDSSVNPERFLYWSECDEKRSGAAFAFIMATILAAPAITYAAIWLCIRFWRRGQASSR